VIFFAVVHEHSDSVLALRIVFSICLVILLLAGVYIFRIRKRLFDRDPEVVADHWAARNLRLWQGDSCLAARGRSPAHGALAVVNQGSSRDSGCV